MPLPRDRYAEAVVPGRHDAFSRGITDRAVTVLRNDRRLLPLRNMAGKKAAVISAYNPDRELVIRKGHKPYVDAVPELLRKRGLSVEVIEVTPEFGWGDRERMNGIIAGSDIVFVDIFGIPSYGIGTMLPHRAVMELFYSGILNCGRPVVVSCIGDPFISRYAPSAQALILTYDETAFSQESAIKVCFGEQHAKGRSPVNLPPWFKRGAGLRV
jgi:hypothetical protein